MTKHMIILNPISGRGRGERSAPMIESTLKDFGLDFDLVRTEHPWHAAELAREGIKKGYDVIVSAGGDGTANETLNGMIKAMDAGEGKAAMGFLSVGRGNDFAYSAGVPGDLLEGCRALAEDHRKAIDVGYLVGGDYPQGRYFGNGVGIGFDAIVGFEALKLKRLHGFASYLVGALKTIFLYFRAPKLRIEIDSETIIKNALMVSIMNGIRLGGGFRMAPQGQMDDGLFDVSIVDQVSRPRIAVLISHFMKGTQATQPEVNTARTRHIVVTALDGSLPAHADGETICVAGDRLALEILPHKIEMICAEAEKGS
jgi:diacylglycerol kinase (ATP)